LNKYLATTQASVEATEWEKLTSSMEWAMKWLALGSTTRDYAQGTHTINYFPFLRKLSHRTFFLVPNFSLSPF